MSYPLGLLDVGRRSSLLFDFRARDGSLLARTGQVGTLARGGDATLIDSNGVVATALHSQPRWWMLDADGDGITEAYLLLEDAGANICLRSEDFSTSWVAGGTPTRVAAAHTASGVTLDLIGDDTTSGLEYYQQTISFTGNGSKAFSLCVKQGSSTSSAMAIADSTAGTSRALGVLTWSNGLPVVTMATGTYLGYVPLRDGVYRLFMRASSVVAANVNVVQIFPATNAALSATFTGTLYAGAVQIENAPSPSSYLRTTSGSVSRPADALSFPFLATPRALTLYLRFIERGTLATGASTGLFSLGGTTNAALFISASSGAYRVTHRRSSDVTATASASPSYGQLCELLVHLYADGSVQLTQSINGAAETVTSRSAANALATAWNSTTLWLNGASSGDAGFIALRDVRIAAGTQTLTYMREL